MELLFSLSEIQIFVIDRRVYECGVETVDNFVHHEQYALIRMKENIIRMRTEIQQ